MSLEGNAKAGYVLEGKITGIPRVDDTLTKEGWCADAKETGDRLAALEGYKDDALEAAETATKAAETASKAADDAKEYAGERFDELADDVETLKTDVEYLKEHGGGGSGGGGSDNPESGGSYDDSAINQRVDEIELRVESVEGDMSLYTQKADGIEQRVEGAENNMSILTQKVNGFTFEVSQPTITGDGESTVYLTIGFNGQTYKGVIKTNGNVDVSGQLSAEALYAMLGDIAQLKVDSLSTSRRIPMYLARDTSDDNYIDIEEQNIVLRRAWTDGSTEQARDPLGALLYWEQNVAAATIGADGYPYVDGNRVFITTEATDYPVRVYKYKSGDRLAIRFDEDNNYGPKMVWGEGDGSASGKGRGYLEKLGLSFDIYNYGTDGTKRGMFMGNDYVDIVGQREITDMEFTNSGVTVTYQGGKSKTMTFVRTSGNITGIKVGNRTITVSGVTA